MTPERNTKRKSDAKDSTERKKPRTSGKQGQGGKDGSEAGIERLIMMYMHA